MPLRASISEISLKRLLLAAGRRVSDIPKRINWKLGRAAQENIRAIEKFRNIHAGQTCVIICNGPSLNKTNMGLVKNVSSICMNRSYLMFDEWGFVPSYFAATAQHVLTQFSDDIAALPMPKFIDSSYKSIYRGKSGFLYLRIPPRFIEKFGKDLTQPISSGGTVTYTSLQLAYYLGFSRVIIIGMDHRFSGSGTPTSTEVRTQEVDSDHMHPNYFPKGTKWELPDLRRSEIAYQLARDAYAADGREIIDCTVGGACTVFRKAVLEDVLAA